MRLVNILWIALLTLCQSHAVDICRESYFGYKAVDLNDPNAYFLCLGILGKIRNSCNEGFQFNGLEQNCVIDQKAWAASESSSSPKNVFNINQTISMYKPLIFNIFGPLWKSQNTTPPPLSTPATTEAPPIITPVSPSSLATDGTTDSSSSSDATDSTAESSSSPDTDSTTESSASSDTDSTTESYSSSSATDSTTDNSFSSSTTDSTTDNSFSSSTTDSTAESSSFTDTDIPTEFSTSTKCPPTTPGT